MSDITSIGRDLRALRTSRKMTLDAMAKAAGKSVGWLSQVERGLSTPTMDDLKSMARVLDVPLSLFFGIAEAPAKEKGMIVRSGARRVLGARDHGLVETLLSPDLTDDFEVIHSTFLPGASLDQSQRRATTEVAYMITGKLDVWINDQHFTVSVGDSFRIKGSDYRWANPYDDPAHAIWVISPPVY